MEAMEYVERCFPNHPGSLNQLYYPTSHRACEEVAEALSCQIALQISAITKMRSWTANHGFGIACSTPSLNIGLLTPDEVVNATLRYAGEQEVPLNSLEGFLRQLIGWREFMRATYEDIGVAMRTTNHWQHHRPMPESFYDGTTGIVPIDDTIQRILRNRILSSHRTFDGAGRVHVSVRD